MDLTGFKRIYINNEPSNYIINENAVCINTAKNTIKKPDSSSGRNMLKLFHNCKAYNKQVARWMLLTFDPIENADQFQADHIDENPLNDNLDNLQWLTPNQNFRKTVDANKIPFGENHPNCNLSDELTEELCKDLEIGELTYKQMREKYNITNSHICGIKYGYYRNDISKKYNIKNKRKSKKTIDYKPYLDSINNLILAGYKNKEIAKELGIEWSDRVSHKLNDIRKDIVKNTSPTTKILEGYLNIIINVNPDSCES